MKRAGAAVLAFSLATSVAMAGQQWPALYPEAPIWIGETLVWAEMDADRVMRLAKSGPETLAHLPGCGPTSVAPYDQGLVVLCHRDGSLQTIALDGQPSHRIRDAEDGQRLRNPNDSFAGPGGGVWFTDPGQFWALAPAEGRLYRLAPNGTVTVHAERLFYGNGVYVDADRGRLLVSEHLGRRVLAYPLNAEGVGPARTLVDLDALGLERPAYPEAGPDGLEIGPDGVLWIAEYGAGRILGWHEGRGLVAVVEVPAQFVTNIAFGPAGLVAITGAFENTRRPNNGAVWLTTLDALMQGRLD